MRRGESCGRCGARRHGKRRHVSGSAAMTNCALDDCAKPICDKHAEWDSSAGAFVCKAHKVQARKG